MRMFFLVGLADFQRLSIVLACFLLGVSFLFGTPASSTANDELLYASTFGTSSTVWIASSDAPSENRRPLYEYTNANGWGGWYALSKDSEWLAIVETVEGNLARARRHALVLVDTSSGTERQVDPDVAPYCQPIWSPSRSELVYLDQSSPGTYLLRKLSTGSSETRTVVERKADHVLLLGWQTRNDEIVFLESVGAGAVVRGFSNVSGKERIIADLSAENPRNFRMSPTASAILITALGNGTSDHPTEKILDLTSGHIDEVRSLTKIEGRTTGWGADDRTLLITAPVSAAEQTLVVLRGRQPDGKRSGVGTARWDVEHSMRAHATAVTVPIIESPDERYIAVEEYREDSQTFAVVSVPDATMRYIDVPGDVTFLGWRSNLP